MDTKLLLVKAITLVFRESQIPNNPNRSTQLIQDTLAFIKPPEVMIVVDFDKDAISDLRDTLIWMLQQSANYVFEKTELMQRLRINCGNDHGLYHAIEDGIRDNMDESVLKKACSGYRSSLRMFQQEQKLKTLTKDFYTKMSYHPETFDWKTDVRLFAEALAPHTSSGDVAGNPSIISSVTLTDEDSINQCFVDAQNELSNEGVIRFGLQGLNRMFGDIGGARRGEQICILALQHKFKSGLAMKMFYHHALYNKPYMIDSSKKPLLLRLSFENAATVDVVGLYKEMVENTTGVAVNEKEITSREAAQYINSKLSVNGYHVILKQIDPSDFTYMDLFDIIDQYESEGYEIHQLNLDYLAMISTKGLNQGPAGHEYRDLFRRVRNRCLRSKILCITPHQMSTEAKVLLRGGGGENFVTEINEKGYYAHCRSIDNELDLEINLHIAEVNGESYLTFQRGKHRKPGITAAKNKYFVYKFNSNGIGNVPDDVNGPDMSRRKCGANTNAEGGELAWYDRI